MTTSGLCASLITQLSDFVAESTECGPGPSDYETIVTPFLYPDRDNIEIFIQELDGGRVLLSDLGQTMMKLAVYGFEPTPQSPRRRAMIFQVVSSANVQYEDGKIMVVSDAATAGSRIWDVAMAIQRLSDLVYTVPGYTKATFSDEFEEFAASLGVPYERSVQIQLPAHSFTADFVLDRRKVIQLISAGSPGYAQERVSRIYVNFNEMALVLDPRERIAVIDDRPGTVDSKMREVLSHTADKVLLWDRKTELSRTLAA